MDSYLNYKFYNVETKDKKEQECAFKKAQIVNYIIQAILFVCLFLLILYSIVYAKSSESICIAILLFYLKNTSSVVEMAKNKWSQKLTLHCKQQNLKHTMFFHIASFLIWGSAFSVLLYSITIKEKIFVEFLFFSLISIAIIAVLIKTHILKAIEAYQDLK